MADLDALLRPFFDELMALRPADATLLGIHDHDHRLPEGGPEDAEAEGKLLRRLRGELTGAAEGAREAIDDHQRWLEGEVIPTASPDFPIGEAGFERLLQLRRLPAPPDAILRLGREQLSLVREQRRELVAKHWPGNTVAEVEA